MPRQIIADLLTNLGIEGVSLADLGDLIFDIATVLADDAEARQPYATKTISELRAGGSEIRRNLGFLED